MALKKKQVLGIMLICFTRAHSILMTDAHYYQNLLFTERHVYKHAVHLH